MYVTLEPCCHHGRTPPCTDAIIKSGIKKVVIGMRDPDPKVSGRGVRILKKHGIQVREGLLRRECEALNEGYVKHRKTGFPFVILKAAATLDGMVANRTGRPSQIHRHRQLQWITSPEARAFVHRIRDRVDGILVGINTVLKDDPRLTTRLKGEKGKDPIRIILDSSLRIPSTAKVLHVKSPAPTWIATTAKKDPKTHLLERKGAEILFCRQEKTGQVDLKDLLRQLGRRGMIHLLVEGGPTVYSSFLREKLADQMVLFLAPSILGEEGIPMFSDLGMEMGMKRVPRLKEVRCRMIGSDILVEGHFSKG